MSKIRLTFQTLALLALMLAVTSIAQAQATRTWVSGVGDDVNPCSRTAPCKTFAGAISKTAAGGEIDALDPGGYGTLTATKSITVDGGGTMASILFSGVNGVVVNDSSTFTINVILRNLSLNGAGTTLGVDGIRFISGKSLKVENSRIQNCSGDGIDIAQTGAGEVQILDTVISNCGTNGINQNAGSVTTSVDRSVIVDNGTGVTNAAGVMNVHNSVINGNTGVGLTATTGNAQMNVLSSHIAHNGGAGVNAALGSVVRISDNDIVRNNGAGFTNAGTMETFRNNRIRGNNVANSGSLTDVSAVGTGIF